MLPLAPKARAVLQEVELEQDDVRYWVSAGLKKALKGAEVKAGDIWGAAM